MPLLIREINSDIIILITLLFTILSGKAVAQTTYGFRLGANVSNLVGDLGNERESQTLVGLVAGSFARFELRNEFAMQVEVLYSGKGAKFESISLGEPDLTLQAVYLEIPMLLTYTLPSPVQFAPRFHLGPMVAFELSERIRQHTEGFEQSEESSDLKSPDGGLVVGADIEVEALGLDALFGLRYTYGLRNLAETDALPRVSVSTRALTLSVGFLF